LRFRQTRGRALERIDSIGELILLAREPAPGIVVAGSRSFLETRSLARDPLLLAGDLSGLEAQLARRPLPRLVAIAAQLLLEAAEPRRGLLRAAGGRRRVVALQLARGVSHLLGGAAHLPLPAFVRCRRSSALAFVLA
jgi:hypothetical protein